MYEGQWVRGTRITGFGRRRKEVIKRLGKIGNEIEEVGDCRINGRAWGRTEKSNFKDVPPIFIPGYLQENRPDAWRSLEMTGREVGNTCREPEK